MKPRKNVFEQATNIVICNAIKFEREWENNNNLGIIKLRREARNFNQLFYDCHSPYNTDKGNPHITEFVISAPMYDIYSRVECKSQQRLSDLNTRVIKELYRVKELPENEYCIVLEGVGFIDKELAYIINDLRTYLKLGNKLWVGTLPEFKTKLISQIKRYS